MIGELTFGIKISPYRYIHAHTHLPIHPSIRIPICLYLCLSFPIHMHPSYHPVQDKSVNPSVRIHIYPSLCLSPYTSLFLSTQPIHIKPFLNLSPCTSAFSPSIHPHAQLSISLCWLKTNFLLENVNISFLPFIQMGQYFCLFLFQEFLLNQVLCFEIGISFLKKK